MEVPLEYTATTTAAPGCQRLVRLKRVCNCKCIDVLKIQVHDSIFVLDQIRTNRLPSHSDSVILYHMFVLDG